MSLPTTDRAGGTGLFASLVLALTLAVTSFSLSGCGGSGGGSSADASGPQPDAPGDAAEDTATSVWVDVSGDWRAPRPETVDAVDVEPIVVRVCLPGERRCADALSPESCNEDGSGWRRERTCPQGGVCHPGRGECVLQCTPAERSCATPDQVFVCSADAVFELEDCPDDLPFCATTDCVACMPDGRRCLDASTSAICTRDFVWEPAATCDEGQACYSSGGFCRDCERSCLGPGAVLTCPADAEPHPASCPEGERCCEGTGCCVCWPGERRCVDGRVRQVCAGDGRSWLSEPACGAGTTCRFHLVDCQPCAPDELLCVDPGTLARCTADGVEVLERCAAGSMCTGDMCVTRACRVEVVVLIDGSGSMTRSWPDVSRSVRWLVGAYPGHTVKLLLFRDGSTVVSLPPTVVATGGAVGVWFAANLPGGATPLQPAMLEVAENAESIWTADAALGVVRYLVLLSDGGGNRCETNPFPLPRLPVGDCHVDGLAAAATHLLIDHGVRTYVIGYNYGGPPEQLFAVARNGGTDFQGYVEAGDEASLSSALRALMNDPKLCP